MSNKCDIHISQKYAGLREAFQKDMDDAMADIQAMRDQTSDPADFKKKLNQYLQQTSQENILNAQNRIQQIAIDADLKTRVSDKFFRGNVMEGLASLLRKSHTLSEGSTFNVETLKTTMEIESKNLIENNLERPDYDLLHSRQLDSEIIMAMNGKTDVNPAAIRIAKVLQSVYNLNHSRKVEAGIPVPYRKGYVGNQKNLYNIEKMTKMGKDGWVGYIKEFIDMEETFKTLPTERIDAYLGDVYEGFIKRQADMDTLKFDNLPEEIQIKSNTARKNLQPRQIIYKQDSLGKLMSDMTDKNLLEIAYADVVKTAGDIAQYKVFGPDGRKAFDRLVTNLREEAQVKGDTKALEALNSGKISFGENIDALWANIDGSVERSHSDRLAYSGFKMVQSFVQHAVLGNSMFTALSDVASMIVNVKAVTGQDIFTSTYDVMAEVLTTYPKAIAEGITGGTTRADMAQDLGVAIEMGIFDSKMKEWGADNNFQKASAKSAKLFSKINPISKQTALHKSMTVNLIAQKLHRVKDVPFNELGSYMQANLKRSGITEADWELFKHLGKDIQTFSGKGSVITGSGIKNLSDDLIEAAIENNKKLKPGLVISKERYKSELKYKIDSFYETLASEGTPTPGMKQRTIANQGVSADKHPISRMMLDSVFMLKSFTLRMNDIRQRVMLSDPAKAHLAGTSAWNKQLMVEQMLTLTAAGYAVSSLNALKNNKTPPDPTNPKTWMDAFVRGGSGGVYGDYILSNLDRGGKDLVMSALGPMARVAEDAYNYGLAKPLGTAHELVTGEKSKNRFKQSDVGSILSKLPNSNHFLIQSALNYTILDKYKEAVSPGHRSRMRKQNKEAEGLLWKQGRLVE